VWLFGYGSLMWDGWEQPFGGTREDRAVLLGHRRSFNKKSVTNWGTSAAPGPTLGLERAQNAECTGTAFEFQEEQRSAVLNLLRGREGASFTFEDLPVRLPDGREVRALTPLNDRTKSTYIGKIPVAQRAEMTRTARGTSGACTNYVRSIHEKLAALGIVDADVEEFAALVGETPKTP
jgi:cation transport protein ChaC